MPLSLPLYDVIFDLNPVARAVEVAHKFYTRTDLDLDVLEQHIAEELNESKQKVAENHDFIYANEQQLRDFLEKFLEKLKELRKA